MRRTLQFLACAAAAWFAFPATATAEPIAITSGVITLPANPGGLPARITLTGSDGTRPFEFQGVLGDTPIRPYDCHACVSQISSDIFNFDAAHGFAKYGNDRYHTGAAGDSEGHLNFNILGGPIPLPLPGATGETRSVSHSFTMSGVIFPPFSMPGAIMNTLTGSGIATLTVVGGPGNQESPIVWEFQRGEYRFTVEAGEPAPVSEPTSFLLFASGFGSLVLKRRSRAM